MHSSFPPRFRPTGIKKHKKEALVESEANKMSKSVYSNSRAIRDGASSKARASTVAFCFKAVSRTSLSDEERNKLPDALLREASEIGAEHKKGDNLGGGNHHEVSFSVPPSSWLSDDEREGDAEEAKEAYSYTCYGFLTVPCGGIAFL